MTFFYDFLASTSVPRNIFDLTTFSRSIISLDGSMVGIRGSVRTAQPCRAGILLWRPSIHCMLVFYYCFHQATSHLDSIPGGPVICP